MWHVKAEHVTAIFTVGIFVLALIGVLQNLHDPRAWVAGGIIVSALVLTSILNFKSSHRPLPQTAVPMPTPTIRPTVFIFPSAGITLRFVYARGVALINLQILSTADIDLKYMAFDFRGRNHSGKDYLYTRDSAEPVTIPKLNPITKLLEANFSESEMLDFGVGSPVALRACAKFKMKGSPDGDILQTEVNLTTVPLWDKEPVTAK